MNHAKNMKNNISVILGIAVEKLIKILYTKWKTR